MNAVLEFKLRYSIRAKPKILPRISLRLPCRFEKLGSQKKVLAPLCCLVPHAREGDPSLQGYGLLTFNLDNFPSRAQLY
jgi:hypothetical protein